MLGLKNVSFSLGSTMLLASANLAIDAGERLCLVGRNGVGKSTLMKMLAGNLQPDSGELTRDATLRVAYLPQDITGHAVGTVFENAASALGEAGQLLAEFHGLVQSNNENCERLGILQDALEELDAWCLHSRIEALLSRLDLDGEARFENLSGGLKRRALLARALVGDPDILLLDEPTNHLDIDSITRLETFLLSWRGTLLFTTHDRAFLRKVATRIVELDRGQLTSWSGGYDDYLLRKSEALRAEQLRNSRVDRKLAREEAWIRQGVQARRARNEGRVRALEELRKQGQERRRFPGQMKLQLQEAERSGKLVVTAERACFSHDGAPILRGFSATILRGDKVGIIGPNGIGKSTLLNLLLGKLTPQAGSVKLGTKLSVAHFDQLRTALKEDESAVEGIGQGREYLEIGGKCVHVMSYLQDFLFTPDRARSPVRVLSGGERSRLLLARLFAQPANLLVLDEPTNDLDVETLELLEERLTEFGGTVLLVSHDREFLDRVVTRSFVFEGDGCIGDYVGGYADWLRYRSNVGDEESSSSSSVCGSRGRQLSTSREKLNYKQRLELEALPHEIERLENEQKALVEQLTDPALYGRDREIILATQTSVARVSGALETAYARWEMLEGLQQGVAPKGGGQATSE